MDNNWFKELFIDEAKQALYANFSSGGTDTSTDTVTADVLLEGYTAHNASGEQIVGTIPTYNGEADGYQEWIGDGNTHLWISLPEGRTSPRLGVGVNGTVTVDWGDGSEPNVLTGTSTSTTRWTPNHEYGKAGDYVITLTVDGEIGITGVSGKNNYSNILRFSSSTHPSNPAYQNGLRRIEMGNGVTSIGDYAFSNCYNLKSVAIPDSVTSFGESAFGYCYSLASINIPSSVTSIGEEAFYYCYNLKSVAIPDSVTSISKNAFRYCRNLKNITVPNSVTSIGEYAFGYCHNLANIDIPESVTSIGGYTFTDCNNLVRITIPDGVTSIGHYMFNTCYALVNIDIPESVTSIGQNAFYNCANLLSIAIPKGVTTINTSAFRYCATIKLFDFSSHTTVPTLANTSAFSNIPADCEIRVPAALAEEWKSATNWSTYASQIVGV